MRHRGVTIVSIDAPIQTVVVGVKHVLRRLVKAELQIELRRRIVEHRRRPDREGIGRKSGIEEDVPDVTIDSVVHRVAIERRSVEIVRCAKATELQRELIGEQFLLEIDLIKEGPLSTHRLLHRVNAPDVLGGEIHSLAIDPTDDKEPSLPSNELLEIKS